MSRFTTNLSLISAATGDIDASGVTAIGANTADVSARVKLSIQFVASAITSGTGLFKVYVSNNGTDWVQYNRLVDNLTNTNAQNDTLVSSVTLDANGSKIYFFPVGDYFRYIGVGLDRTTDGTYSAILQAID